MNASIWNEHAIKEPATLEHGVLSWVDTSTIENAIKHADIAAYDYRSKAFNLANPPQISARDKESLQPILALPKDAYILELGGGDGRFGHAIMKEGFTRVMESDLSRQSVTFAAQVANNQGLQGTFAVIDSENLPFKDNSMDAVYMVASLHHVPSATRVLEEIHRVLKPGGMIAILREPASWQYYVFYPAFKAIRWFVRRDDHTPHSLADDITFGFTEKFFKRELAQGFTNINIVPVHYTRKLYTNFIDLFNKVLRLKLQYNQSIEERCASIDAKIGYIPGIRSLTWDWDVYATKKEVG